MKPVCWVLVLRSMGAFLLTELELRAFGWVISRKKFGLTDFVAGPFFVGFGLLLNIRLDTRHFSRLTLRRVLF